MATMEDDSSQISEFILDVLTARAATIAAGESEKSDFGDDQGLATKPRCDATENAVPLKDSECLVDDKILISRLKSESHKEALLTQQVAALSAKGILTEVDDDHRNPHGNTSADESPSSTRPATRQSENSRVGAFAVRGISATAPTNDVEEGREEALAGTDSGSGVLTVDGLQSTAHSDAMVNATLVDDDAVVNAEKAPEGFKALVQNKRFKYLVGAIFLLLIVIIVPVAILVPSNQEPAAVIVLTNGTDVFRCGTARTNQTDYRGFINVTASGLSCKPWASQHQSIHDFHPSLYPAADLSENYCKSKTFVLSEAAHSVDPIN